MGRTCMNIELAVIGGTGVYALGELADVETHQPVTAYGAPSGPIRVGTYAGKRVAFLARLAKGIRCRRTRSITAPTSPR